MKKYERYKAHLYDWLPEIPSCWESLSLRSVFSLADERKEDRTDLELLSVYREYGVIPKASRTDNKNVESENTSKYKVVKKGDLVINKMKLWQGSLGISQYDGFVSPAYIVAHSNFNGNLQFLNFLLRSPLMKTYYNRISYGIRVGQWDSDFYDFKQLMIPVPPREEQDQIVRFLDYKISKINSLIKGYQKQIKLLKERRANVIEIAVTQGIDDSVELKDSGTHWLPKIPTHWNMIPSKWLFSESKQKKLPDDVPATASQQFGIISQADYMKKIGRRIVVANQGLDDWKHVEPNNFVISLRSFQGGLERSDIIGCVTWHYIVLIPQKNVNPDYFKWLLKSKSYIKALQGTSDYIRDGQDLRYSDFVKVSLPVIPYEEQQAIADFISDKVAEIDNAIPRINSQIDLLKEYRTRLISDVVTGQIDVRDEVIPEYTAVEDEPEQTEENEENNLLEDGEENI